MKVNRAQVDQLVEQVLTQSDQWSPEKKAKALDLLSQLPISYRRAKQMQQSNDPVIRQAGWDAENNRYDTIDTAMEKLDQRTYPVRTYHELIQFLNVDPTMPIQNVLDEVQLLEYA